MRSRWSSPRTGSSTTSPRCSTASTACSSAAAPTSTRRRTGTSAHPELGPDVDRVADEYELALLRAATARDLPLLAICRGMQALNVARGGTLHQHLPDRTDVEHRQTHEAFEPAHAVTVRAGSPLHRLTGKRRIEVNCVPPPGRRRARQASGAVRARA